jgi:hypothetical protein
MRHGLRWIALTCFLILEANSLYAQSPSISEPWVLPHCSTRKRQGTVITTGALRYSIPKGLKVVKVKDVDYWEYKVFKEDGQSNPPILQLWFCVNCSPAPDRHVKDFVSQSQRRIVAGDFEGLDAHGISKTGGAWRVAGVGTEFAMYENMNDPTPALFDSIIETMCYEPSGRN